jgi:hypothetical protein
MLARKSTEGRLHLQSANWHVGDVGVAAKSSGDLGLLQKSPRVFRRRAGSDGSAEVNRDLVAPLSGMMARMLV